MRQTGFARAFTRAFARVHPKKPRSSASASDADAADASATTKRGTGKETSGIALAGTKSNKGVHTQK